MQYRLNKSELAQRYFTCAHCGAQGEVIFGAEGSSGWQKDSVFTTNIDERVAKLAESDLRTDAARTQALIECPTCGRRSPGAVRWAGIRIGFWVVLGATIPIVGGAELAMGALFFGGVAIWQAWRERGRFKRAGRAVITKLVAGKLPEPDEAKPKPVVRRQLAPPPDLPVARVVVAPAPVAHEEAPDPTAPPRFLKP